jgi:hypothetical protein
MLPATAHTAFADPEKPLDFVMVTVMPFGRSETVFEALVRLDSLTMTALFALT